MDRDRSPSCRRNHSGRIRCIHARSNRRRGRDRTGRGEDRLGPGRESGWGRVGPKKGDAPTRAPKERAGASGSPARKRGTLVEAATIGDPGEGPSTGDDEDAALIRFVSEPGARWLAALRGRRPSQTERPPHSSREPDGTPRPSRRSHEQDTNQPWPPPRSSSPVERTGSSGPPTRCHEGTVRPCARSNTTSFSSAFRLFCASIFVIP